MVWLLAVVCTCAIPAMANRDAKRQRLAGLVGLKGISTSGLAAVMKRLQEDPVEPMSARQIDKFIAETYAEVGHTIDLPLVKGGSWAWKVCRLDNLMNFFAKDSAAFREAIISALHKSCDGHLSIVLYLDKVTPGAVLRPDNRRKFWAFYLGFRELPATALFREQFWLPLAVLRTQQAQGVLGGISNCFRLLLRSVLLGPCEAAEVGFAVNLDSPRLIKLKVTNVLADEAALKQVFSSKGASGLRPCLLCKNIVSMSSNLTEGQDYLVDVSCSDVSLFDPATNTSIWETYDNLAARRTTLTKTAFENLEKASGFTYNPNGLLADHGLRKYVGPATTFTMDWLHNFLCHGVASVEITALLNKCKSELGITYAQLDAFVKSDWVWPSSQPAQKIVEIFSPSRDKGSAEGFRGSGSEILMVFPLLRYFAIRVLMPTEKVNAACKAFFKMCHVLDEFLKLKKGGGSNQVVLGLMREHVDLHKAAYGTEWVKPKHHFAYHNVLGQQCEKAWLDCFVHERKHQVVKVAGTTIQNTRNYEASVLGRVLLEQWRQLQGCNINDCLLGQDVVDDRMSSFFNAVARVAKSLQFGGLTINVGDLVLVRGWLSAFLVHACVVLEGRRRLLLLVQRLARVCSANAHSTYNKSDDLDALMLGGDVDVSVPYCWTWSDDQVVVLHSAE